MKRFLIYFFALLVAVLQPLAAQASYFPETALKPSPRTTFSACTGTFTTASSATDVATLTGSSSKTIALLRVEIIQASVSVAASHNVYLVKRSTANSGGTSSTITSVPLNSGTASATVKSYTANPTTGTTVGKVSQFQFFFSANGAPGNSFPNAVLFDADKYGGPLILSGTGDVAAVNFNGVTDGIGTDFAVRYIWLEY